MRKVLPILLALECVFNATAAADELDPKWIARSVVDAGDFSRLHIALAKAFRGEAITIAAIGGSITAGAEQSRKTDGPTMPPPGGAQSSRIPRSVSSMRASALQARISARHRIRQDVLVARPDVVMIEFAVNDAGSTIAGETLEGLCTASRAAELPCRGDALHHGRSGPRPAKGAHPSGSALPRAHGQFSRCSLARCGCGKSFLERHRGGLGTPQRSRSPDLQRADQPPFRHGRRYAARRRLSGGAAPAARPLISDTYENTGMYTAGKLTPVCMEGWQSVHGAYGKAWRTEMPGSVLEFDLEGTAIGLAYKKQQAGFGRASVSVDGGEPQTLEGYFPQDWGGGYTPFVLVGRDLAPSRHRLSITVLDEKAEESPGNAFEIHAIFSAGLPHAPMHWTRPRICGTLWWLAPADPKIWTEARLAEAIDAQQAAGFDLLWILNTPQLLEKASSVLDTLYVLADAHGMRVIIDLPRGGWHGETSAETLGKTLAEYADRFAARYAHPSFYGWYLNHEINPIAPDNAEESAYWRAVWKTARMPATGPNPARW